MKYKVLFLLVLFIILSFSFASAEVPKMINYQGKVTTPQGALIDTVVSMTFIIYADSLGMLPSLWGETQDSVLVEKGVFSVLLGSVDSIPDTVFTGAVRYLGVKVGDDPEMSPLKPIVSVAYAYTDGDWTVKGDTIYRLNGRVAIGTTSPDAKLEIKGSTSDLSANTLRLTNSNDQERFRVDNAGIVYSYTSSDCNLSIGTYGYNTTSNAARAMDAILERQDSLRVGDREGIGLGFRANDDGGGFPDRRFASVIYSVAENPENSTRKSGLGFSTTGSGELRETERMRITGDGNVGIGITNPAYELDVEGYVQAYGYYTGDIIFLKDKKKLWRMYEDEDGLYIENLKTGKVYRFVLQEVENK